MTDNEIIKALECCTNKYGCPTECPLYETYGDCLIALNKPTLDLINRQKAEIERLGRDVFTYKIRWAKAESRETKAKAEAEAEAIKEFAERFIQEDGYNNHNFDDCASILLSEEYRRGRDEKTKEVWKLIKRIKKEMVGDTNE